MWHALMKQSAIEVKDALEKDSDAAWEPFLCEGAFYGSIFEPPICCAARFNCNEEIIGLLLAYGADVDAVDSHGSTPLAILSTMPCFEDSDAKLQLKVAARLLAHGSDLSQPFRNGLGVAELARFAGQLALARLFDNYRNMQACLVLVRAAQMPLKTLNTQHLTVSIDQVLDQVLGLIWSLLLPAELVCRIPTFAR